MFLDEGGAVVPSPDPDAGLYIRDRVGNEFKVTIPADMLAFQIGETAQVHSGGLLIATPHGVQVRRLAEG
jgi:isopenicillin N synthase-like dioxygenase